MVADGRIRLLHLFQIARGEYQPSHLHIVEHVYVDLYLDLRTKYQV